MRDEELRSWFSRLVNVLRPLARQLIPYLPAPKEPPPPRRSTKAEEDAERERQRAAALADYEAKGSLKERLRRQQEAAKAPRSPRPQSDQRPLYPDPTTKSENRTF